MGENIFSSLKDNFLKTVNMLYTGFIEIPEVEKGTHIIKEYISIMDKGYRVVCTELFKWYVFVHTHLRLTYDYLYEEYPIFKMTMDDFTFYQNNLNGIINRYNVEPNEKCWILTKFLMDNDIVINSSYQVCLDKAKAYQSKSFEHLPHEEQTYVKCTLNESIDVTRSIVNATNRLQEGFILSKLYDDYICHSYFNDPSENIELKFPRESCEHYLINVEYSHPDLDYSIKLDLHSMYLVGNIVLTPMFLHHFLSLQPLPYIIDDKYTLNIIDHNVNNVVLDCNKYIVFDRSKYIVKSMKSKEE